MTSEAWEKAVEAGARAEEHAAALEAKARNCRDNARADGLVADAFRAEYMAGISGQPTANAVTNARSMELYDFVILGDRRARTYTEDAQLFEAAATALRARIEQMKEQS